MEKVSQSEFLERLDGGQENFKNFVFEDLVLKDITIRNNIDFSGSKFITVKLERMKFEKPVNFTNCEFEYGFDIDSAEFFDKVIFRKTVFPDSCFLDITEVRFHDDVFFNQAILAGGVSFFETSFEGSLSFKDALISPLFHIRNSSVRHLSFDLTAYEDGDDSDLEISFEGTKFEGFLEMSFKNNPRKIVCSIENARIIHCAAPTIPLVVNYGAEDEKRSIYDSMFFTF
ncbi:TPA: hypothetical protein DEW47_01170 [Patescibacteria group bacterium]|nr:MAG: hypothetical protein UT71_C0001G0005 [Parcubacteria group bacterium GW2011_GWF2_40_10]KKR47910.1 MAG: hypothetical protein UT83_C0002G0041 [Parcubacteria group bacterium GW2011_GWA2_40_143]KKR60358.1 MAG: hypothetical protein UT97_C0002G0058 [Parcubacteria group bacterium GW2011_GWC2_40_31]KKR75477.1 MAG: hypothetical protein UU20_C0053G0010 [Parcubacteria group bacterium GW2011_GWE2_40_8]KKR82634.1 MAG: hypothetical protein UU28_C0007G0029 [Parcubacteria group bacterium GW2011_GWD2_40_